jgi:hypothetical protein
MSPMAGIVMLALPAKAIRPATTRAILTSADVVDRRANRCRSGEMLVRGLDGALTCVAFDFVRGCRRMSISDM